FYLTVARLALAAVHEQLRHLLDGSLSPVADLHGVHVVLRSQLVQRPLAADRLQRHPRLELRTVLLSCRRHRPLLSRPPTPKLTYCVVQILGTIIAGVALELLSVLLPFVWRGMLVHRTSIINHCSLKTAGPQACRFGSGYASVGRAFAGGSGCGVVAGTTCPSRRSALGEIEMVGLGRNLAFQREPATGKDARTTRIAAWDVEPPPPPSRAPGQEHSRGEFVEPCTRRVPQIGERNDFGGSAAYWNQ